MKKRVLYLIAIALVVVSAAFVVPNNRTQESICTSCDSHMTLAELQAYGRAQEATGKYAPGEVIPVPVAPAQITVSKGDNIAIVDNGDWNTKRFRFVVCMTAGCSMNFEAYFIAPCHTCDEAKGLAGCCPQCGQGGTCSDDGPCQCE